MAKAKTPAKKNQPNFEVIHGPTVLTALQHAIDQFQFVQQGRFNKAKHVKGPNYNQAAVDHAIELSDKFKSFAGQLNPGSHKARQALDKLIDEAK